MRNLFKAFPFLMVVLWIIGGTCLVYYLSGALLENAALINTNKETLIKDGTFEISLSKPIRYSTSQSEANLTKEVNDALVTLADYLIEQPTKRLLITGYYTLEEEKQSEDRGVGRLRAENLKNHLIALGAAPGNIFISAELDESIDKNVRKFKGAEFTIIDEDNKRLNTNPILESGEESMTSFTTFIIPYYTTNFEPLDILNEELTGYIERVLEHPEMVLAIESQSNSIQAENLLSLLYNYIKEMTLGTDIPVVKQAIQADTVSDRVEQNIKIDIGIKRFQNNLEL